VLRLIADLFVFTADISQEPHVQTSNFSCISLVAKAQSCYGSIMICYVHEVMGVFQLFLVILSIHMPRKWLSDEFLFKVLAVAFVSLTPVFL